MCLSPGSACPGSGGLCAPGKCLDCGGPGQPCCDADPACELDATCADDGICRACGGVGQPCCAEARRGYDCLPNAVCDLLGLGCVACGGPGQPCCRGDACGGSACCMFRRCFAEGETCQRTLMPIDSPPVTTRYGTCKGGRCDGCGRPGTPCCPLEVASNGQRRQGICDAGSICQPMDNNGELLCVSCGGSGQTCCEDGRCNGGCCAPPVLPTVAPVCTPAGSICPSSQQSGGRCDAVTGSCSSCGAIGQPCCEGGVCNSSAWCIANTCQSCGQVGELCCAQGGCAADLVCGLLCVYGPPP
jgi:hypothetical protein